MFVFIGITEILPERMRVQAHNLSYSACIFRGFLDGAIVQSQTCNVDTFGVDNVAWGAELHAEHRERPSAPPWVNNSLYLCRVPGQVYACCCICMLLYMRAAVYGCCYIGLLLYRAAAVYGCCCCYIWLLLYMAAAV